MRILTARDHRVMPWKNGLGTTTEIAVEPEGSGLDDFTWRISIADLGASGPFSTFAGCDRVIVQLEGAPMTLEHEGSAPHRLGLLVPHRFAGEVATHGTLDSPPARDFNVMVRRDRARAEVDVHELAPGASAPRSRDCETIVVFVLRGAATLDADDTPIALAAYETCIADGRRRMTITAGREGAVIFVVALRNISW